MTDPYLGLRDQIPRLDPESAGIRKNADDGLRLTACDQCDILVDVE